MAYIVDYLIRQRREGKVVEKMERLRRKILVNL
jgi:hypothetical protein